jgi:hypothetical protein
MILKEKFHDFTKILCLIKGLLAALNCKIGGGEMEILGSLRSSVTVESRYGKES